MRRGTIYLAGPMTGLPGDNYPAFDKAAKRLSGMGWAVLNPAESYSREIGLPYAMYMRAAINLLLQANGLALMEGWARSQGARMEVLIAQRLEIPIYNAHTGHRMRLLGLRTTTPYIVNNGESSSTNAMVQQLIPVAKRLAKGNRDGITVTDVRKEGLAYGILKGDETAAELSALGRVMKLAGLVHVSTTRRSDLDVTHKSYQTIWFEDLASAA